MSDLRATPDHGVQCCGPQTIPPMPTPSPLRSRRRVLKPHQRRALVLLAGCGTAGCTEEVMLLHGFRAEQLAELVRAGFADTIIERAVGGAQTVWKISEAGRRALGR